MGNKIDLASFWRTFEQILIENGEPFKIVHEFAGREVYWACINKYKSTMNINLHVSLVNQKNCVRVGLYISDRNTPIGRVILANKESINNQLSFTPVWENGAKNPNTLNFPSTITRLKNLLKPYYLTL
ncbi:MAG: DUF4268 domain-containing protein [Clostridia bacterium]|nr:DUF4268 domain-containing protein [Clostridia bacterium]